MDSQVARSYDTPRRWHIRATHIAPHMMLHMETNYAALSRVICIANGKGGVSKTSVTANVAGLTAAASFSVLVVDLDPQGDLADDLGYFKNSEDDQGRGLANALLTESPAPITLKNVRSNLDVITGGVALADVSGALLSRMTRGNVSFDLLAKVLAPIAGEYDVILIDTPPVDTTLQRLALGAARWLLIPTKSDASSIRGMERIAQQAAATVTDEHRIDLLGILLTGSTTSATRVRAGAEADIRALLGDDALLFGTTIRASEAVAREGRDQGLLVHELAEKVEGQEPFWKALRDGKPSARLPGSAPALAGDYVLATDEIIKRINELEDEERGAA